MTFEDFKVIMIAYLGDQYQADKHADLFRKVSHTKGNYAFSFDSKTQPIYSCRKGEWFYMCPHLGTGRGDSVAAAVANHDHQCEMHERTLHWAWLTDLEFIATQYEERRLSLEEIQAYADSFPDGFSRGYGSTEAEAIANLKARIKRNHPVYGAQHGPTSNAL